VVNIPESIMNACILAIIFVGAFSVNNSIFDVFAVLLFGVLGLILKVHDYPVSATALGFVLGYLVETNFRRSLTVAKGNWMIFFQNPISLVLICIAIISVIYSIYSNYFKGRKESV
jgi:putative tricarboxylic transport membrane protein